MNWRSDLVAILREHLQNKKGKVFFLFLAFVFVSKQETRSAKHVTMGTICEVNPINILCLLSQRWKQVENLIRLNSLKARLYCITYSWVLWKRRILFASV